MTTICRTGIAHVLGLFVVFLTICSDSRALAIHADYLPVQDAGGKLVTGLADYDNNVLSAPVRLFHRDLDSSFFGSDPGFTAVSQANVPAGYFALPPNIALAFDFAAISLYGQTVSNLWYWDGVDANSNGNYLDDVDFHPVVGTTLTARFTPFSTFVDGGDSDVPGFNIQTTTDTGAVHRHLNFQLSGGPGGMPAEGLYLESMRVRMAGLAKSDPFYTVFVTTSPSSAAYNAAVSWAGAHLLLPGDVNTDAAVNIFDINVVSAHWGQSGPTGDANYDGTVNIFDINLISSNWGAAAGGATSAVPEPATWVLVATGFIAWRLGRGRRKGAGNL